MNPPNSKIALKALTCKIGAPPAPSSNSAESNSAMSNSPSPATAVEAALTCMRTASACPIAWTDSHWTMGWDGCGQTATSQIDTSQVALDPGPMTVTGADGALLEKSSSTLMVG